MWSVSIMHTIHTILTYGIWVPSHGAESTIVRPGPSSADFDMTYIYTEFDVSNVMLYHTNLLIYGIWSPTL